MRTASIWDGRLESALTSLLERTMSIKRDGSAIEGVAEPEPDLDHETFVYRDIACHVRPALGQGEIENGQLQVATREVHIIAAGDLTSIQHGDVVVLDDGTTYDILRWDRVASADMTQLTGRKER